MKEIIRKGDSTDHGDRVLEGLAQTNLKGKPMVGVGHQIVCPKCKGMFAIAEGGGICKVDGVAVALRGMKTDCGASLIASGHKGRRA